MHQAQWERESRESEGDAKLRGQSVVAHNVAAAEVETAGSGMCLPVSDRALLLLSCRPLGGPQSSQSERKVVGLSGEIEWDERGSEKGRREREKKERFRVPGGKREKM